MRPKVNVKDFRFFIAKVNVLKLYRDFMKELYKKSSDVSARDEMVQIVKEEFLAHKDVENLAKIDYLLAIGRKKFNQTRDMLDMSR